MQPPKELTIQKDGCRERANQQERGLKRKRSHRVVVKDCPILTGLMSLLRVTTHQWDFISPLTFIKDKETQKSVERLKTFGL